MKADWEGLPGAELVKKGLEDLERGEVSEFSLLLLVAKARLSGLGVPVENTLAQVSSPFTHALYSFLETQAGDEAHSRYNSLIRRLVSFERALEREQNAC